MVTLNYIYKNDRLQFTTILRRISWFETMRGNGPLKNKSRHDISLVYYCSLKGKYKGKGEFDITANAKIAVAADWDVGRAIVITGNDTYILHPVIQLFVIETNGFSYSGF